MAAVATTSAGGAGGKIELLVQYLGAGQTDDYAHFLMLWAQALPETAERMISLLQDASHRMRRRISEAEAQQIVEEARIIPRPRTPDGWARALRLKYELRQLIGIQTIGAIDVNKRQRAKLRKLKRRERDRQRRQQRGARPRVQSLSRTRPWEAEGISRRTWERRRKTAETHTINHPSDANARPAIA